MQENSEEIHNTTSTKKKTNINIKVFFSYLMDRYPILIYQNTDFEAAFRI